MAGIAWLSSRQQRVTRPLPRIPVVVVEHHVHRVDPGGQLAARGSCGPKAQSSTMVLKPPQNMRLPSKGMALGSIIGARRGSFITLALTLSRCLRDL